MMVVPKRTTLILGAGASKEAGLPVGSELKSKIAGIFDIPYEDDHQRLCGDREEIVSAIISSAGGQDITTYLDACWKIRDAMPLALSIDSYIDTHVNDKLIERCGKLGITKAILDAERRSLLYFNERFPTAKFNFLQLEDTWFNRFFQRLTGNYRVDDLPGLFETVTFISFNYDRCIEHFLYHALQNYFGIPAQDAADLMETLDIYHPYGKVGNLPWASRDKSVDFAVDFGGKAYGDQLVRLSSQIRTFTEGTDPEESDIKKLRARVAESERLIFLGFAYHDLNMKVLKNDFAEASPKQAFGTALGISESDCKIVASKIENLCKTPLSLCVSRTRLPARGYSMNTGAHLQFDSCKKREVQLPPNSDYSRWVVKGLVSVD